MTAQRNVEAVACVRFRRVNLIRHLGASPLIRILMHYGAHVAAAILLHATYELLLILRVNHAHNMPVHRADGFPAIDVSQLGISNGLLVFSVHDAVDIVSAIRASRLAEVLGEHIGPL